MRWLSYILLAYLSIAVQIGLSPYLAYHEASPNLVLLVVIFIAVNAPRDAALLACFLLGVLQDMVTQQQPGLFAFSYGVVALFVVATQQVVYKEHPLTHLSLALVAGLITAFFLLLHGWVLPPGAKAMDHGVSLPAVRLHPTVELTRVVYTALVAPFVLGALQRMKRFFGFQAAKRRSRMW